MSSHSDRGWADCIDPHQGGHTTRCSRIASELARDEDEVLRLARLASRSQKAFAKFGPELRRAKELLAGKRRMRDEHMAVCPGALDRFSAA